MLYSTINLNLFAGILKFELKNVELSGAAFMALMVITVLTNIAMYLALGRFSLWAINYIFDMSIDYAFGKVVVAGLMLYVINGFNNH